MIPILIRVIHGLPAHYRPGTTDEAVLREVLENRSYRRASMGFDVKAGERWLDLGANIGAFALYCRTRGATAECYEPDPGNFKVLRLNAPGFNCYQTAVSARPEPELPFWKGRNPTDHYRATMLDTGTLPRHPSGTLPNLYGGFLKGMQFDGVKMDIEGAEGGLIDLYMVPKCEKLCMEYHNNRDKSTENLRRRLGHLKELFQQVKYPPEYDRLIAAGGGDQETFFDRMIFCKGWRNK